MIAPTAPSQRRTLKDIGGVVGLGAAACAACCAGPILAFLGGASILGFASTTVIGAAGIAVGTIALVAYLFIRARRTTACSLPDAPQPVAVDAPKRLSRTS